MAVLLEPILNQILQAEMTEHPRAEPSEKTGDPQDTGTALASES